MIPVITFFFRGPADRCGMTNSSTWFCPHMLADSAVTLLTAPSALHAYVRARCNKGRSAFTVLIAIFCAPLHGTAAVTLHAT